MWISIVCTHIDNDTGHHSGQNLLWTHLTAPHEFTTFNDHCDDAYRCRLEYTPHQATFDLVINSAAFQTKIITAALLASLLALLWFSQSTF